LTENYGKWSIKNHFSYPDWLVQVFSQFISLCSKWKFSKFPQCTF